MTTMSELIERTMNETSAKVIGIGEAAFVDVLMRMEDKDMGGRQFWFITATSPKMNKTVLVTAENAHLFGASNIGKRVANPCYGQGHKKILRWAGQISWNYAKANDIAPVDVQPIWNGAGKHVKKWLIEHIGKHEFYIYGAINGEADGSWIGIKDRFFVDATGAAMDDKAVELLEACIAPSSDSDGGKTPKMFSVKSVHAAIINGVAYHVIHEAA